MAEIKELENGGFDVEINLTDLCENHLINNISKIMMPKGINVIPNAKTLAALMNNTILHLRVTNVCSF